MIEKTILFEDFDGNQQTETFCFHLSKADIVKIGLIHDEDADSPDDLYSDFQRVVENTKGKDVIDLFEKLIALSVGIMSDDGKRFIRNDEIRDNFMQTDAYSELLMELLSDPPKAEEFMKNILPKNIEAAIEKVAAGGQTEIELPGVSPDKYTREELLKMTDLEFEAIAGTDMSKMPRPFLLAAAHRGMAKKKAGTK